MKLKLLLILVFLSAVFIPGTASAAPPGSAGAMSLPSQSYFLGPRNEYRVDYTGFPANPPGGYGAHFVNEAGVIYESTYTTAPTGIMYLTCNGTYYLQMYDAAGAVTHETAAIVTNQIVNGSCSSYAGNTGYKDFDSSYQTNPAGGYDINWSPMTGASNYDVYKDGSLVGSGLTGTTYNTPTGGSFSIMAKDAAGTLIGQSDLNIPTSSATPTDPAGGCDGCKLITDALNCPDWSRYMGEWSNMIKNSVPPAPDWQSVANIMRDTIVPAMGEELIKRSPEMAKIIADEFQSREKAVTAPAPMPEFTPSVPTLTDMPNKVETNLNEGVPDFTPDMTGSQPFTIPDPAAWVPDNTDQGYVNGTPDLTAPEYVKKPETIETDKGYKPLTQACVGTASGFCEPIPYVPAPAAVSPAPAYTQTSPAASSPAPAYQTPTGSPMPGYSPATTAETIPGYQIK